CSTAVLIMLSSIVGSVPGAVVLGRSPLDRVVRVISGHFTSADTQSLLLVQDLGQVELIRPSRLERSQFGLLRLAVVQLGAAGFSSVWASEPLASLYSEHQDISGTAWALGDVDGNGLDELVLFSGHSCRVLRFTGGAIVEETLAFPGAAVAAAAVCDVNNDGISDIVTLELPQQQGGDVLRLVRVYQQAGRELVPHRPCYIGINWGSDTRITILGSARLDDYPGTLPVVAGIRVDPKPSIYVVLYEPRPDSLVMTANPFPWQEWFSKTRVLPAGELALFNVGDTLVGYGYFVPGSRPAGPSESFAALQDGEWRLLSLTEQASRLSGPVCRFCHAGTEGWLAFRENLFYFYPGEVFRWR
ncbi:MAG: VCBS repeat-containing protein, partial [candidate division WOR-3 bacterium]